MSGVSYPVIVFLDIHVHAPRRELLRECPGIIKTMHTGFSAARIALCHALVLTRKKPDVAI